METEKVPFARPEQVRPTSNWVFIEAEDPAAVSDGGVALPLDRYTTLEPSFGRVIAAGPGLELRSGAFVPMDLEPGARVIFMKKIQRDVSQPITLGDLSDQHSYWMIRRGELLGVVVEEEAETWSS